MKILHFSDLHGCHIGLAADLIARHRPEWIVLTGDILPDFRAVEGRGNRLDCQQSWWSAYRRVFQTPESTTTLTLGNHELEGFRDRYLEVPPRDLEGQVGVLEGNPSEFGAWGFSREFGPEDLQREVDALESPRVILSHCPPHGCLDRNHGGESIGHRPLRRFLEEAPEPPSLVLCGHVHEAFGACHQGRTLVVNSSNGYALIELDLDGGAAAVTEMARMDDLERGGKR